MNTATEATTAPTPGVAPLAAVVPLTDLYPSPSNPRKHFDGLNELALSLSRKGVEIPLIVRRRPTAQGDLEIVDGERRYKAALQAGLQFMPVIHRDQMSDADVLEMQLENALQRSDLTPLEEARGIKALIKSAAATPAEIAKRMSRSERFIADRIRLLELVPELQQLLDQGRIGIEHAERLAKLTKDQQKTALASGNDGRTGGLWADEGDTLDFDTQNEADPYAGLKVVTVKELEAWIARHVRFDVDRMAETAPLEFAAVKRQVDLATAKPGRRKPVIEITHDHHLRDDVKDPARRVYGPMSWRRADGTVYVDDRGKEQTAKTCEASVLGVVAVGPEYGTAFQVCIARDTCQVHFGSEIREREKNRKLRESGDGAKANAREAKSRDRQAEQQKRAEAERKADNLLYRRAYPKISARITEAVKAAPVTSLAVLGYLWNVCTHGQKLPKEITTIEALVRARVAQSLKNQAPAGARDDAYTNHNYALQRVTAVATQFGVDLKPQLAATKAEIAAEAKAVAKAAPASADAKPTAKKAAKTKAAKKR